MPMRTVSLNRITSNGSQPSSCLAPTITDYAPLKIDTPTRISNLLLSRQQHSPLLPKRGEDALDPVRIDRVAHDLVAIP